MRATDDLDLRPLFQSNDIPNVAQVAGVKYHLYNRHAALSQVKAEVLKLQSKFSLIHCTLRQMIAQRQELYMEEKLLCDEVSQCEELSVRLIFQTMHVTYLSKFPE